MGVCDGVRDGVLGLEMDVTAMEENDRKWPKDFRADEDDVDVGGGCVQPVPDIVINL